MTQKQADRKRFVRSWNSKRVDHRRQGRLNRGAWTARNPPRYRGKANDWGTGSGRIENKKALLQAAKEVIA